MIPTSVLVQLATIGLSAEQAKAVGDMLSQVEAATREAAEVVAHSEAEERREKGRARWRKWKDGQGGANVSKRLQPAANVSNPLTRGDAPVEDNLLTKKISGKEEKKEKSARDELALVLDAEHAQAVVDHRQRLRKPLTPYAARKLAAQFSKAPEPNLAADKMLEKGWAGFEVGWLEKSQPHSTAPPQQSGRSRMNAYLDSLQGKTSAAPASITIDASDDSRNSGGVAGVVQFDAFAARLRS